ncbi:MAG TPA: DUF5667 domain-containing protein [Mycobacteriales bacterium]|nr:DUF5667 domain-containing protein [Mycobacteriales bacterium]
MTLSPTKRRAEEFADLLERDARTDDPGLAPLVALSAALQSAADVDGPTPEFRAALRQRLVAVAAVQGVGETPSVSSRVRESASGWRFQRRVAVLAGGAAAITAVAGVGIGASRSLPGDAFYGLKRATESVQLAIAQGDEAKGEKHLEFARTRLAEVRALADRGEALPSFTPGQPLAATAPDGDANDLIASTLQAMDTETRAGAEDLFLAYQHSGSTEPLATLHAFTREQYAQLMALLPALPDEVQPPATRSLALLRIVATDTVSLAPHRSGSGSSTPGAPRPHRHPTPSRSSGGSAAPHVTPTTTTSGSSPSSDSGSKQQQSPPTVVPTIPPIPTVGPLPTDLPTELPDLSDLRSALPLIGG